MVDQQDISIDFDVHKAIESARTSFAETPNSVLRRLLGIDGGDADQPISQARRVKRAWSGKGVLLAHGTDLRMEYNGRVHFGAVDDGEWLVEQARYNSPSAAAGAVARTKSGNRTSLDGWLYWYAKQPGSSDWVRLSDLRKRKTRAATPQDDSKESLKMASELASGGELPTENEVILQLEAYLSKQARPVSPTEAYSALADDFGLTAEQRHRMMQNSDEVHWENRVRQARRKLVNAGRIDAHLPRGSWGLRAAT